VGVWLGQDATGEHRRQLPRQGSQGYAQIPPSHSDLFTYLCLSGMGKALARSTSRVSAENAEDLSQPVRIRFHLRFLHSSILLNVLISPLRSFRAPNLFCTVRFKVIADDGTVILIPCETSPVDVEAHAR
jgi:hypothetical protein